ncbi:MAG TPA: septum formation protein Maf [Rhodospirillaceae bacterium]|nr:septum formation protein Maf [Rhodospirillaceae bacterium]HAA92348.1 septum formation protein Maf [Rhodospirillaceae bacterium]HAT36703.1 septum formation protein Maf [Rhodospirillaceae bacterium]|tara:strand:- start:502 stop:1113 length:612 start_codon:yes stop_codon:yes gene_type:complete
MGNAENPTLILASASPSRAAILRQAGIDFGIQPSDCDEDSIKTRLKHAGATVSEVAQALAEGKAEIVAGNFPSAYIIAADQMLECDDSWLDKPKNLDQARDHLKNLRGKTHFLVSSTVVYAHGSCVWRYGDRTEMRMRNFSDAFLEKYLSETGDEVCRSVGAYQLEGLGAQLFDEIGGDYFSILGLPLLPMMRFLREEGIIDK